MKNDAREKQRREIIAMSRCLRNVQDIETTCYSFKIEEPAVQELSQQLGKY